MLLVPSWMEQESATYVDLSEVQTRTLMEKWLQCALCVHMVTPTWLELPVQFSGMSQLFTASLHTTPMNSIYGGHRRQMTVDYVKQKREREREQSHV